MEFYTFLGGVFVAFNALMVSFVLFLGFLEWRANRGTPPVVASVAPVVPATQGSPAR